MSSIMKFHTDVYRTRKAADDSDYIAPGIVTIKKLVKFAGFYEIDPRTVTNVNGVWVDAVNGNNANTGNKGDPVQTIAHAITLTTLTRNILVLMNGDYFERHTINSTDLVHNAGIAITHNLKFIAEHENYNVIIHPTDSYLVNGDNFNLARFFAGAGLNLYPFGGEGTYVHSAIGMFGWVYFMPNDFILGGISTDVFICQNGRTPEFNATEFSSSLDIFWRLKSITNLQQTGTSCLGVIHYGSAGVGRPVGTPTADGTFTGLIVNDGGINDFTTTILLPPSPFYIDGTYPPDAGAVIIPNLVTTGSPVNWNRNIIDIKGSPTHIDNMIAVTHDWKDTLPKIYQITFWKFDVKNPNSGWTEVSSFSVPSRYTVLFSSDPTDLLYNDDFVYRSRVIFTGDKYYFLSLFDYTHNRYNGSGSWEEFANDFVDVKFFLGKYYAVKDSTIYQSTDGIIDWIPIHVESLPTNFKFSELLVVNKTIFALIYYEKTINPNLNNGSLYFLMSYDGVIWDNTQIDNQSGILGLNHGFEQNGRLCASNSNDPILSFQESIFNIERLDPTTRDSTFQNIKFSAFAGSNKRAGAAITDGRLI